MLDLSDVMRHYLVSSHADTGTQLQEIVSNFVFCLGPRTNIYLKFGWQFFVIRYISDVQMKAEL